MDNKKSLASKLGNIFTTVVVVCLMALVIAATVKVIFWIF